MMTQERFEKLIAHLKARAEANEEEAKNHRDGQSCDALYESYLEGKYRGCAFGLEIALEFLQNPNKLEELDLGFPCQSEPFC